jgi:hypothetical protein
MKEAEKLFDQICRLSELIQRLGTTEKQIAIIKGGESCQPKRLIK